MAVRFMRAASDIQQRPVVRMPVSYSRCVNGNGKCTDFGNRECSDFGNNNAPISVTTIHNFR